MRAPLTAHLSKSEAMYGDFASLKAGHHGMYGGPLYRSPKKTWLRPSMSEHVASGVDVPVSLNESRKRKFVCPFSSQSRGTDHGIGLANAKTCPAPVDQGLDHDKVEPVRELLTSL